MCVSFTFYKKNNNKKIKNKVKHLKKNDNIFILISQ